jgi:hypothetical protein
MAIEELADLMNDIASKHSISNHAFDLPVRCRGCQRMANWAPLRTRVAQPIRSRTASRASITRFLPSMSMFNHFRNASGESTGRISRLELPGWFACNFRFAVMLSVFGRKYKWSYMLRLAVGFLLYARRQAT